MKLKFTKDKEKIKKPIYKRLWFILTSIISVFFTLIIIIGITATKFDWNEIVLNDMLPAPESESGIIETNTDSELLIKISSYSDEKYTDYVKACKEKGFDIDIYNSVHEFEAHNNDGYKLNLYFDESNNNLKINLQEPLKLKKIQWFGEGLTTLIPKPNSNIGLLKNESSVEYCAYFGEITIDSYNDYVNSCFNKGFNIDYERNERLYEAYDAFGNYLELEYTGYNIMSVRLTKASEEETTEISTENTVASSVTELTSAATTKKTTSETVTTTDKLTTNQTTSKKETTVQKETASKKATTAKKKITAKKDKTTKKQNSGRTVYRTATGEKYHYENPCGRGKYYPCSLEDAKNMGLDPCEKCVLH